MKSILLFFITLIATAYPDAPDINPFEQAALTAEPSAYVKGCVNAITGDYIISHPTVTVQGAEPITLNLQYVSSNCKRLFSGWTFQSNVTLIFNVTEGSFRCPEKNGVNLSYRIKEYARCIKSKAHESLIETKKGKKKRESYNHKRDQARSEHLEATLNVDTFKKGLCYCPYYDVSGRLNLKNNKAYFKYNEQKFTINASSGEKRYYTEAPTQPEKISKKRPDCFEDVENVPFFKDEKMYLLREEKLPNGNRRIYTYDKYNHLIEIRTANVDDRKTFAWVKIDYLEKSSKSRACDITTSDGKEIHLRPRVRHTKVSESNDNYVKFHTVNRIEQLKWPGQPQEQYYYFKNRMISRTKGNTRPQEIKYYSRTKPNDLGFARIKLKKKQDARHHRVLSIREAVGEESSCHDTVRLDYQLEFNDEGWAFTDVYDPYDNKTQYRYNEDFRLLEIRKYQKELDNNVHCKRRTTFAWGKEGADETTLLLAKTLWDGDKGAIASQRYYYDENGNVVEEKVFGNMSGQVDHYLLMDKETLPTDENEECFSKRRTFSKDGKNLLLREEDDSGMSFEIIYHPGTDLVASKLIRHLDEIKIRNFFEYNEDNILVKTISDDGITQDKDTLLGVTERKVVELSLKEETPFIGMPASVEQRYLDLETMQEKLVERRVIHYSSKGYIEKEDIYDADGKYCYSTSVSYDDEGRPIKKTNAHNHSQALAYNENFQEAYVEALGGRSSETIAYDKTGRLIKKERRGRDAEKHVEVFSYDLNNRIYRAIDAHHYETKYTYTAFGETEEEIKPEIYDENDQLLHPKTSFKYDALGRNIVEIDPKGNETHKSYNAYNQPTLIVYPDGSTERFIYNLDGTIKVQIDQLGTEVHFTYDYLKRILSKRSFSSEKELLLEETNTYDALHLLSSTDANGNVSRYYYDDAGRKIREEISGSIKDIEYDSLGRERKIIERVDSGDVSTIQEKDYLGHVVEERVEGRDGEIQYLQKFEYDAADNKTAVINFIDGRKSKISYEYDGFDRLIRKIDPLNNVSSVEYDEGYSNRRYNLAFKLVTTDPLGRRTTEEYDALDRVVRLEKRSKENVLLFEEKIKYDLVGNPRKELRSVLSKGKMLSEQLTLFEYDDMNRKTLQTEGVLTSNPKRIRYKYDLRGHLTTQYNPNGVHLQYDYDALGRKITFSSSDGKCHYSYVYDSMGNLLEAKDLLSNQTTKREYDPHGRIVLEELANGLWIENIYDAIGRKIKQFYPDDTSVAYGYDGSSLKHISRRVSGEDEIYHHSFEQYDLSGRCLDEEMLCGLGKVNYGYTLLGQLEKISSPYAHVEATEVDAVGKILKLKTSSTLHHERIEYEYDDLDQLISEKGGVFSHDYGCDSLSNRLSKDEESYQVNDLNQLLATDDSKYAFDPNGNPISQETEEEQIEYEYDPLDRLISLTIGEKIHVSYTYDAFHRRVAKEKYYWVDGAWGKASSKKYLFDDEKEIGEVGEEGHFRSFRILNPHDVSEIGSAVAIELDGHIFAPVHDLSGSVLGLVSLEEGKLTVHYCYGAFGESEERTLDDTRFNFLTKQNPWKFSSKRFDDDAKMYYFGRRYYDPNIGRWINPDPAGFTDGPNLYAYVRHCPVFFVDHYGLRGDLSGGEAHGSSKPFMEDPGIEILRLQFPAECSIGTVGEWEDPTHKVISVNGILTSLNEAIEHALTISKLLGGMKVTYIHNASNGFNKDADECTIGLLLHAKTEGSILIQDEMNKFLSKSLLNTIVFVNHSQGNILCRNALEGTQEKYRNRVRVIALAPAAYFREELCESVVHIVSEADWVPTFDRGGRKACLSTTIRVAPPKNHGFWDHDFMSHTYQSRLGDLLNRFISLKK